MARSNTIIADTVACAFISAGCPDLVYHLLSPLIVDVNLNLHYGND